MFPDNNESLLNHKKQQPEPGLPSGIIGIQKIDLNIRGIRKYKDMVSIVVTTLPPSGRNRFNTTDIKTNLFCLFFF